MNTHRHKKDFILFRPNAILSAILLPLFVSPIAFAEDIVYEGGELQKNPVSSGQALFPQNSLSGNSVTSNVIVNGAVFGGVSTGNELVSNNRVNISAKVSGNVYGGYSDSGSVLNNQVFVSDSQMKANRIYGGYVYRLGGNASNNHVEISNSAAASIHGGHAYGGDVISNSVTINNVIVDNGDVYAGYVSDDYGVASDNHLIIRGDATNVAQAGGASSDEQAMRNSVEVNGGKIKTLYGAITWIGPAYENSVIVNNGSIGTIYGGYVIEGSSESNTVTVNKGIVTGILYGGYGEEGTTENRISKNRVRVNGGTLTDVYGGFAGKGGIEVSGNEVHITGGDVKNVYGGWTGGSGNVNENKVSISGGLASGDIHGGYALSGNALGNTVSFTGGKVTGNVYGGYGQAGTAESRVSNNIVEINADVSGSVYGGFAKGSGHVSGNEVRITGGTVQNVYGGSAQSGDATGNRIVISGGKVTGQIVGGVTENSAGDISGNSITIGKNADVSGATISGGDVRTRTRAASQGAAMDSNTLNVDGYQGKAISIANFSTINFVLNGQTSTGGAMLTLQEATDLTGVKVNLVKSVLSGGGTVAGVGSSFNLIASESGLQGVDLSNIKTESVKEGMSLWYDLTPELDGNAVKAVVSNVRVDRQTGIFNTARLATLEFVNQGTDVALGYGLDKAAASVEAGKGSGVFGMIAGTDIRNDVSGGSAKASGSHFLIGAAAKVNQGTDADLLAGGFVQAGWGDVEGHCSESQGSGDTNTTGLA